MKNVKLDSRRCGLTVAIIAVILWTICRVAAFMILWLAMNLSGDFAYTDIANFDWQAELVRFIAHLFVLCPGAMLAGDLAAHIYNFLIDKFDAKLP